MTDNATDDSTKMNEMNNQMTTSNEGDGFEKIIKDKLRLIDEITEKLGTPEQNQSGGAVNMDRQKISKFMKILTLHELQNSLNISSPP
jgi:hypothetical protein